MLKTSFTLESLLETHELPFMIIDADLKIAGINRAFEIQFGVARDQLLGKPCCNHNRECRHQHLFQKLEPYSGVFPNSWITAEEKKLLRVRGYPLLNADGMLYLGECLTYSNQSTADLEGIKMLGSSPSFLKTKTRLLQAAETLAPVHINGETGTGKELAAEFVHKHSKLSAGEFVIVDCTSLGENLFESELFGHEKGAFTGAISSKKGLFEVAHNGTVFLDEIGELPLAQQAKLLRALESGKFRRVGGTSTLSSRVRIISATNRDLAEMVRQGSFREDLFYRLSVFPIHIPPLRERKQDLPELANALLAQLSLNDEDGHSLSVDALSKLMRHNWPGNIRELRNCLQMATGLCANKRIEEKDIIIMRRNPRDSNEQSNSPAGLRSAVPIEPLNPLEQMELNFLNNLSTKYNGNRKLMAIEMNVSERTLYRKLSRFNLN
jgi:two-component system response regulator AtoC